MNYTSINLIKTEVKEKKGTKLLLLDPGPTCRSLSFENHWEPLEVKGTWDLAEPPTSSLPCEGTLTRILGLLHQDCSLCSRTEGRKGKQTGLWCNFPTEPELQLRAHPGQKQERQLWVSGLIFFFLSSPDHRHHPLPSRHIQCFHRNQNVFLLLFNH